MREPNTIQESFSQLQIVVSMGKWVEIGWADFLLLLTFVTRWNTKHPSYIRIRLFFYVSLAAVLGIVDCARF